MIVLSTCAGAGVAGGSSGSTVSWTGAFCVTLRMMVFVSVCTGLCVCTWVSRFPGLYAIRFYHHLLSLQLPFNSLMSRSLLFAGVCFKGRIPSYPDSSDLFTGGCDISFWGEDCGCFCQRGPGDAPSALPVETGRFCTGVSVITGLEGLILGALCAIADSGGNYGCSRAGACVPVAGVLSSGTCGRITCGRDPAKTTDGTS